MKEEDEFFKICIIVEKQEINMLLIQAEGKA